MDSEADLNPVDLRKVEALLGALTARKPEWLRMPPKGELCPYFNLTCHGYYTLLKARKIKSRLIKKKPTDMRGTRLINFASVQEYLDSCPDDYADNNPETVTLLT